MLHVYDIEQNSPEWYEARRGLITASELKSVMAKGQGALRRTYMRKLAGEIMSGEIVEGYKNADMQRGHEMEADVAAKYEFMLGVETRTVGFMRRGCVGCSPDRLVGDDGVLEIKTKLPHLMVEVIQRGTVPPEHYKQAACTLFVSGRQWIDVACYWPTMPLQVFRLNRADVDFVEIIAEIDAFSKDLIRMVEDVEKRTGVAPLWPEGWLEFCGDARERYAYNPTGQSPLHLPTDELPDAASA